MSWPADLQQARSLVALISTARPEDPAPEGFPGVAIVALAMTTLELIARVRQLEEALAQQERDQ